MCAIFTLHSHTINLICVTHYSSLMMITRPPTPTLTHITHFSQCPHNSQLTHITHFSQCPHNSQLTQITHFSQCPQLLIIDSYFTTVSLSLSLQKTPLARGDLPASRGAPASAAANATGPTTTRPLIRPPGLPHPPPRPNANAGRRPRPL